MLIKAQNLLRCFLLLMLVLHGKLYATTFDLTPSDTMLNHWSLTASLGYSHYYPVYYKDKQSIISRMAVTRDLLSTTLATFGFEAGVQNGKNIRLVSSESGALSPYLFQAKVRPMLDLLVTATSDFIGKSLFFAQVKGGFAYRQWLLTQLNDQKPSLGGEIQAGFGCPITELTSLNLVYQGIFSNSTVLVNRLANAMSVPIPSQHGMLLGFSIIA